MEERKKEKHGVTATHAKTIFYYLSFLLHTRITSIVHPWPHIRKFTKY